MAEGRGSRATGGFVREWTPVRSRRRRGGSLNKPKRGCRRRESSTAGPARRQGWRQGQEGRPCGMNVLHGTEAMVLEGGCSWWCGSDPSGATDHFPGHTTVTEGGGEGRTNRIITSRVPGSLLGGFRTQARRRKATGRTLKNQRTSQLVGIPGGALRSVRRGGWRAGPARGEPFGHDPTSVPASGRPAPSQEVEWSPNPRANFPTAHGAAVWLFGVAPRRSLLKPL
jgi:hypothetical protein